MPRAFCILGVTANVAVGIVLILQVVKSGLLARWTAPSTSAQRSYSQAMSMVTLGLNPVLLLLLLRAPSATLPAALLVMGMTALFAIDAVGAYAYASIASDPDLDAKCVAAFRGPYLYIMAAYLALLVVRAVVYAAIVLP